MGAAIFWSVFAGVIFAAIVIYLTIKGKVQRYSCRAFGTPDLLDALDNLQVPEGPRSLNACDSLLLPQILTDFPDFDATLAETYVREYLLKQFGKKESFTIHNTAMAQYLPSAVQKTIVYQAAVSWVEEGKTIQKRFDLHYTYLLDQSKENVAANCPNCGGAMGYGVTVCPYCGSRVANVLGNTWEFTEIKES